MFIPDQFDPISLPSLPLSQRKDLPKCSGIYFAIDNQGELQHIGRAVNLKARWQAHSKGVELSAIPGVRIAYLEADVNLLPEIEAALIAW